MSSAFVATQGLESTPVEEGAILFHSKSGKFIMLNRSAAVVWTELATPKTEEQLAHRLHASFTDMELPSLRKDVRDVLDRLKELELISPTVLGGEEGGQ